MAGRWCYLEGNSSPHQNQRAKYLKSARKNQPLWIKVRGECTVLLVHAPRTIIRGDPVASALLLPPCPVLTL